MGSGDFAAFWTPEFLVIGTPVKYQETPSPHY